MKMGAGKVKKYKAWFQSRKSLQLIAKQLLDKGIIESFGYDYENIYEWIEASINNPDLKLNISRKHLDWKGSENENITILMTYSKIEPANEMIELFGQRIANEFGCVLSLGTVDYLNGEDYSWNEIRRIYGDKTK